MSLCKEKILHALIILYISLFLSSDSPLDAPFKPAP